MPSALRTLCAALLCVCATALAPPAAALVNTTALGAVRALQTSALSACSDVRFADRATLAAGVLHGCALTAAGAPLCWGDAAYGEATPPSAASNGQVALAVGYGYTCTVSLAGRTACWGRNYWGVQQLPSSVLTDQVFVAAGGGFACSVSAMGAAVCWGANEHGQSNVPADALGIVSLSTGDEHVCAALSTGQVLCWGNSDQSRTSVPADLAWSQVAVTAAFNHACALSQSGAVRCWGDNSAGQCSVPEPARSGQVALAAGGYWGGESHTCSLSARGIVACWGSNTHSQATVPTLVSEHIVAIAAGWRASCALSASRDIFCWGSSDYGVEAVPASASAGIALPCRSALLLPSSSNSPSSSMTPSITQTATTTPSSSQTAMPTSTRTPGLACPPSLFRNLRRTDLVGIPLSDTPLAVSSEGACRIACCSAPSCDGYAFAFTELRFGDASCFLYANVTATAPSSGYASGLRADVVLRGVLASSSPVGTPLPAGGRPQRGGSVTPTVSPSVLATPSHTSRSVDVFGTVVTVAGSGSSSVWSYNGEQALGVGLWHPTGVAVAHDGTIVISDHNANFVFRLSGGLIFTVAGTGVYGFSGDEGPANQAAVAGPFGVSISGSGDVYIGDRANGRIRCVSGGVIRTVVSGLVDPVSPLISPDGGIYIADFSGHTVRLASPSEGYVSRVIAGNGQVNSYAGDGSNPLTTSIGGPHSLAFGTPRTLLIAGTVSNRIFSLSLATGYLASVAGNGAAGFSGDSGRAVDAQLSSPHGIAFHGPTGAMFIADTGNNRIRMVTTSGIISTVVGSGAASFNGDGLSATATSISGPRLVVFDGEDLLFSDSMNNRIRRAIAMPNTPSPSPTASPYCSPSLFRSLSRMDLVGTLVGTALTPGAPTLVSSPADCRQACCDAPACDGFSFGTGDASYVSGGTASCFLLINITQLIPNNAFSSGIYESTL